METLTTQRLILREWRESDVKDLFEYASSPLVGPKAGWKPHKDEAESKTIIEMFIKNGEVYAIELESEHKVIGGIGLHNRTPNMDLKEMNQREIGYVLNPSYWGNGYVPEAVQALLELGFEKMNLDLIWLAHYEENSNSKRVIEKSGFDFQFKREEEIRLLEETKIVYYYVLERDTYLKRQKR